MTKTPSKISVLRAEPSTSSTPADIKVDYPDFDNATVSQKIKDKTLFIPSNSARPVMNVVFFPKSQWKDISDKSDKTTKNNVIDHKAVDHEAIDLEAIDIFDYLGLHEALFAYLLSSRSGWCYAADNDQYSFMFKEYPYMLAWSFNRTTLETRAMVAARDEFGHYSNLKRCDGTFDLPGLRAAHLYHPLSLACICLIDSVFYFDGIIVEEGYKIGDIETNTGHGLWVNKKKNIGARELPYLTEASRDISRVIGVFANLFKSVEVAQTIIDSLEEQTWTEWFYEKGNADEKVKPNFEACKESFKSAVALLKLRIKTINQSGHVIDKRAEAQSYVVNDLMRRVDAETSLKDSSDMKVIAIMTMAFLPATFFAALFAIPSLDWKQENVITSNFWVYWVFTLPMTFFVFVVWDVRNEKRIYPWLKDTAYPWLRDTLWKRKKEEKKEELPQHEERKDSATTSEERRSR